MLAVEQQVSASTPETKALAALLFLYRELLDRDLELEGVVRARKRHGYPWLLTPGGGPFPCCKDCMEVEALVAWPDGYAVGLPLIEARGCGATNLDFSPTRR